MFKDTDGDILSITTTTGTTLGNPALGINVLSWTTDGWPYLQ